MQDRFETVPSAVRSVDGFRGVFVVAPREGLVAGVAGNDCTVIPSGCSWRPVGQEIVYGTCPDPDVRPGEPLGRRGPGGPSRVLSPGEHTVEMEAHLAGTDIVLRSGTLVVDLSCPVPLEE